MSLHSSTDNRYKFTRRVKRRYQARVWDGRVKSHINLGCYDEDRAAWDASKRFIRRNEIPSHVLPYFVRHQPDGTFCGVAVVVHAATNEREVRRVGPFETPCEAHVEMILDLLRMRVKFGASHPRRLVEADNPAIAGYCLLKRPWAWTWPNDLAELIGVDLVEACRRKMEISGGYAEAARRWADTEYAPEEGARVIRLPRIVVGR